MWKQRGETAGSRFCVLKGSKRLCIASQVPVERVELHMRDLPRGREARNSRQKRSPGSPYFKDTFQCTFVIRGEESAIRVKPRHSISRGHFCNYKHFFSVLGAEFARRQKQSIFRRQFCVDASFNPLRRVASLTRGAYFRLFDALLVQRFSMLLSGLTIQYSIHLRVIEHFLCCTSQFSRQKCKQPTHRFSGSN